MHIQGVEFLEATTILEGLSLARHRVCPSIMVELDAMWVIQKLIECIEYQQSINNYRARTDYQQHSSYALSFQHVKWNHNKREINLCVD